MRHEEQETSSLGTEVGERLLTRVVQRASSFGSTGVRVRLLEALFEIGSRANHFGVRRWWDWAPRPLRLRPGRA
jgi:hypothetical protein